MGFWQMGHILVTQIAYQGLSTVERSRVSLYASEASLFGYAPNFVECATWADDIKVMGLHAFDQWHYSDTPLIRDGVTPPPVTSGDLIWSLGEMLAAYKSLKATPGSRAFAIRMLAHLVGDASQPLHACSLYSKDFPKGDRGGNSFSVTYRGSPTNLHAFWDSGAFRLNMTVSQPISTSQLSGLLAIANDIMAKHPRSEFTNEEIFFDPDAWVSRSYQNAVENVYAFQNVSLALNSALSEAYSDNAYALTIRMIALAGYRLQYLIQKFDDIPPPTVPDFGASWPTIVGLVATGTLMLGYVAGIMTYYIWQKRKKHVRFLNSLDHDSENDMLVGNGREF